MTILEAIILGIIQGATEFLPISSSGHLLLVPAVLHISEPDLNTTAIAHLGTLLAVLIYFRRDVWAIIIAVLRGLYQRRPFEDDMSRLGWQILAGTIPAAVAGLLFESTFDRLFGNPTIAAVALFGTAALLIIGERLYSGKKLLKQLSWLDAIIIGLFQLIALMPGISRSGSTITGGLARDLDRATAARFSFLLGIPAIAGAGALAVLDLLDSPTLSGQLPTLGATFVVAAVVGYACIAFLLAWLRQHRLYPFAIYCAAFGAIFLILQAVNFI
ncbi:MAG: undecaprenyl-diphosphatase UppP [Candidatus Promineifilaceae bacterium]